MTGNSWLTAGFWLRSVIFLAGFTASWIVYPIEVHQYATWMLVSVAVGLLPAVLPRRHGPELALMVLVGCWLWHNNGDMPPLRLLRALLLANLLYVIHAASALAAVVPAATVAQPGAIRTLVRRLGVACCAATLVSVLSVLPLSLVSWPASSIARYLGLVAMLAVVGLLGIGYRRNR
jgi:hypothetical protein